MKRIELFELNQECKDKDTGNKITLTHAIIGEQGVVYYRAQPKGEDPKAKGPVDSYILFPDRIKDAKSKDHINLPVEILHTEVQDVASGVKGMATQFVLHMGNCLHVVMIPKGKTDTGATPTGFEVDIRRVKSPLLKPMTREEVRSSQAKTPSPAGAATMAGTVKPDCVLL